MTPEERYYADIEHQQELDWQRFEQEKLDKEPAKVISIKTMNKVISELKQYMEIIQDFDKDSAQDATALHAYLITLTNYMARANLLMAEYNKKFREEKKEAYRQLTATVIREQKYYAPSLAKDYIDSQCSESGYVYDLAERLSRLCTHTSDAIRTIISSLKSERIFSQYQT